MSENRVPNVDQDLEHAMAAEAVYAYERYLAFGVSPADYASPTLQGVVQAAAEAWEADGAVNLETAAKALQRAGKLAALGGATGLAEMLVSPAVPDPERLIELRKMRKLRESFVRGALELERGSLAGGLEALGTAQTDAIDASRASDVVDVYELGVELLEHLSKRTHAQSLVHPGLELLQKAAGDFPLGSMTIVGGGTNVGKSSFALEMLMRAAERNVTSGFVSCEDPRLLMSARVMSSFTGMSSRQLAQGSLQAEQWPRVTAAYGPISKIKGRIKFAFPVGGNEIDVCAAMSRMAMHGAKLIVVDYVQAIESSKKHQDRRNEIRWLCARIKAHAVRLNVALVLLSQLGRPAKGDEFREPTKHDLREAGDLENAAEFVVLLWRESEDDFAPVNVKLAKSKFGNIGTRWTMTRDERTARFAENQDSYESAAMRRQKGAQ